MQTAIEWLIKEMNKTGFIFDKIDLSIFEQAKEIEKQQTCIFGAKCCVKVLEKKDWSLEELYNETFNTK